MFMILKKASLIACLFYFLIIQNLFAQEFNFQPNVLEAYRHTLNFEFDRSAALLSSAPSAEEKYVQNLNESLELLLTEDPALFSKYETRFEERSNMEASNKVNKFVLAEMNLHWAFVYLKFGHELDAASHFRKAYRIAMDCRKKNPTFIPIRKTTGVLEVMVGAVPEKYTWIMDLFAIHGAIDNGLHDLSAVKNSNNVLAGEARLIHALISGYVLQPASVAALELSDYLKSDSMHAVRFAAASLFVKAGMSENAFKLLEQLDSEAHATPLEYYVFAEVLLHRGEYLRSITAYKKFLEVYKGENNIKDAHYKVGICYRLAGNEQMADSAFAVARSKGIENVEADRSAGRTLSLEEQSNVNLIRARYFIDGGYFEKAKIALSEIRDNELKSSKDKVEFYYRKARLEHGQKHPAAAKLFYKQVIDMAEDEHWYFAPNACLQMGYLLVEEKKSAEAKAYFKKALSYSSHEYKNSIDSKAKTALNQLKRN
jgi:tetratricopeptide (TPR) repeat protein